MKSIAAFAMLMLFAVFALPASVISNDADLMKRFKETGGNRDVYEKLQKEEYLEYLKKHLPKHAPPVKKGGKVV